MKRFLLKLLPGLCLLLLAGTALAGGVVVSLDGEIANPQAGTPFDVNFTIHSAHDGSAQDGFQPIVKATHTATGETITAHGQATGEGGHYIASVTLPTAGTWNWEVQPEIGYPAEFAAQFTPLEVSAPSAAAAAAQAAPSFAGVPVMLWGVLAGAAVLAVLALAAARRLPQVRA